MHHKQAVILKPYPWKKLVIECFERDGYLCQICGEGRKDQLVPHHIILKSRLRLDILDNLLTACVCHIPLHDGLLEVSIDDLIRRYAYRLKEYV